MSAALLNQDDKPLYHGLSAFAGPDNARQQLSSEYLAKLAYHDEDTIRRELTGNGFTDITFYDNGVDQAFIAYEPAQHMSVVSFRGTEDMRTWSNNGDLRQTLSSSGGNVHHGMHDSLFNGTLWGLGPSMADDMNQQLNELFDRSDMARQEYASIMLTGHSRGGALAMQFAADRAERAYDSDETERKDHGITDIITFNAPPVGTQAFANAFNYRHRLLDKTENIHTSGDLEMWGNLQGGLDFFVHPGTLKVIDYDQRIQDYGVQASLMDHDTAGIRQALLASLNQQAPASSGISPAPTPPETILAAAPAAVVVAETAHAPPVDLASLVPRNAQGQSDLQQVGVSDSLLAYNHQTIANNAALTQANAAGTQLS